MQLLTTEVIYLMLNEKRFVLSEKWDTSVFRRQYQEEFGSEAAALWGQQSDGQQGLGPRLFVRIFCGPIIKLCTFAHSLITCRTTTSGHSGIILWA